MIGVSRESVSRLIAEFEEQGQLELEGPRVWMAQGPPTVLSALNVLSNGTWLVNARRIRFERIARYGVGPRAGTAADFPEFTLSAFPL